MIRINATQFSKLEKDNPIKNRSLLYFNSFNEEPIESLESILNELINIIQKIDVYHLIHYIQQKMILSKPNIQSKNVNLQNQKPVYCCIDIDLQKIPTYANQKKKSDVRAMNIPKANKRYCEIKLPNYIKKEYKPDDNDNEFVSKTKIELYKQL